MTTPPTEAEVRGAELVILKAKLAALEELAEVTERLDALRAGTPPEAA